MANQSQGATAAQPLQPQGYAVPTTGVLGRPTSPSKQILLYIVTFGIWGLVWVYRQFEDIKNWSGEGVGGGLGLVITMFVGIVTPFLLANEIETKLYQRDGKESPVHTATGAWVLLPIVGAVVWYLKVQRALNEFWMSKGAESPS
jgi:hypothetical protein